MDRPVGVGGRVSVDGGRRWNRTTLCGAIFAAFFGQDECDHLLASLAPHGAVNRQAGSDLVRDLKRFVVIGS
jgi:hypothetical protein